MRIGSLFAEFRRRGVFRAVAAYAVVAWGASLAATDLLPTFGAPEWAVRAFIACAALGLPIVAVLAWLYEVSTGRIVRDPGRPPPRIVGAAAAEATLAATAANGVRVRWTDAQGDHEHLFSDSFVIGRDEPCELWLDDPHISRRHAEIRREQGRWWLLDLGSRNGTRLDGKPVRRAPLPPSCAVQLYDAGPELRLDVDIGSATITVPMTDGAGLPVD